MRGTATKRLLEQASQMLSQVVAVVPHTDADGLAAGAMALRHRGEAADAAVLIGRGHTPFGADAPLPHGAVAVLDWGVRQVHRPGLLVDHHAPETEPREDQVLVSSYGEEPAVPTAPLMRRILPNSPAWLAAVGAFGDAGSEGLKLPECEGAARTAVGKLVPLINAPRRLPDGPVQEALAILVESKDAHQALADPRIAQLAAAKDAWRKEYERAVRTAPVVREKVALIRFASPCQVHPLVASAWARRLSPRVVIAANDGYLPQRVNFAVRGGTGDLRQLLKNALPETTGEFAHGHDRATGGSLPVEAFEALLQSLHLSP